MKYCRRYFLPFFPPLLLFRYPKRCDGDVLTNIILTVAVLFFIFLFISIRTHSHEKDENKHSHTSKLFTRLSEEEKIMQTSELKEFSGYSKLIHGFPSETTIESLMLIKRNRREEEKKGIHTYDRWDFGNYIL